MPIARLLACAGLFCVATLGWGEPGITIAPNEDGEFAYNDDFDTPRCLTEAFLANTGVDVWEPGSLQARGPERSRTLVYRFHGSRTIESLSLTVEQMSNALNLGGQTLLHLSRNGLDWTTVADSATQAGDANGWQAAPFEVSGEAAQPFCGGAELWVRLVLDNYSGLKTTPSNIVKSIHLRLGLGAPLGQAPDPQERLRRLWGQRREQKGWSAISLDWNDPDGRRAPHYYEDSDGWLRPPGEAPQLDNEGTEGFRVQRTYRDEGRSPLSLAAFVHVAKQGAPLLARLRITAGPDSSRSLRVLWDGRTVETFDTGSFIPRPMAVLVRLTPATPGVHELRLAPSDQGPVTVQEISIVSQAAVAWSPKPPLPPAARLTVLSAAYLPDPEPPVASQVVEGRQPVDLNAPVFAGLQRFHAEHDQFGALRVIVRNPGPHAVRLRDNLLLNGEPMARSLVDFVHSEWDARGVVWHRIRPRTLAPGGCAEVYVRFRRRPEGDSAKLTIACDNAPPLSVSVPYSQPTMLIDAVTPDKTGEALYVYVRGGGGAAGDVLRTVELDGERLINCRMFGGDFADGVTLCVAKLRQPLAPLSFHAVTVRTASGKVAGAQFRALPWLFPLSSIHVPSQMCRDMGMNLGMWRFRSLEECNLYELPTTTGTERMFDAHEQVRFILGPDEPDANDNRGGGYDRGLGYHARRLMDSGWAELVASQAPHVGTWVIMNGTTRPLNWCVYGQFADMACFDPYPVNFYGADHAYVRESLSYARQCGMPRRMVACLEAFGWSAGQGVPAGARGPVPEEWRQNVVQAIGSGAKGVTSWVYVAGAGGWQLSEPLQREMARMNGLIARIADLLLLGTPVDWASTDAGTIGTGVVGNETWPKDRVWAGALLCGPDAIVVTVANHIPASKPEPPAIVPARDVTVTVRLPAYLQSVSAAEVTESGEQPIACSVAGGSVKLRLDEIVSGRVFVLRRS